MLIVDIVKLVILIMIMRFKGLKRVGRFQRGLARFWRGLARFQRGLARFQRGLARFWNQHSLYIKRVIWLWLIPVSTMAYFEKWWAGFEAIFEKCLRFEILFFFFIFLKTQKYWKIYSQKIIDTKFLKRLIKIKKYRHFFGWNWWCE